VSSQRCESSGQVAGIGPARLAGAGGARWSSRSVPAGARPPLSPAPAARRVSTAWMVRDVRNGLMGTRW